MIHPGRSGVVSASLPPVYGQAVQDQQLLEFNGNSSVEAGKTVSPWREWDTGTTTTPVLEEGVLTLAARQLQTMPPEEPALSYWERRNGPDWGSLRQLHGLQACYNIGAGKCAGRFAS